MPVAADDLDPPGRVDLDHRLPAGRVAAAAVDDDGLTVREAPGDVHPAAGLDAWAADNLLTYLTEQQSATGEVPSDTTIVVERFRDELGDWRIVVHSPYGARVHAPWAIVIGARLREKYGVDAAAMHSDDGIVLRLPDMLDGSLGPGLGAGLSADDPWAVITRAVQVSLIAEERAAGLLCSTAQARRRWRTPGPTDSASEARSLLHLSMMAAAAGSSETTTGSIRSGSIVTA